MSSNATNINWAAALGIVSIPLSVLFAVICAIYTGIFVLNYIQCKNSFTKEKYSYLCFWGILRAAGFVLRAICLVGDNSQNQTLCTTAFALGSVGFVPLLKVLLKNGISCAQRTLGEQALPFQRIDRLANLVLIAFVALIITYIMHSTSTSGPSDQDKLFRDIGYWGLFAFSFVPTMYGFAMTTYKHIFFRQLGIILAATGFVLVFKSSFTLFKNYNTDLNLNGEGYFYGLQVIPELIYSAFWVTKHLMDAFSKDDLIKNTDPERSAYPMEAQSRQFGTFQN